MNSRKEGLSIAGGVSADYPRMLFSMLLEFVEDSSRIAGVALWIILGYSLAIWHECCR